MLTRNELLADHFMKVTGIAAVYADAAGANGAVDAVGIAAPRDRSLLCCAAGRQHAIIAKAAARVSAGAGQAAALAGLRSAAAELGIGLTLHETVIRRAFAAVQTVDQRIVDLQRDGGMKEMNRIQSGEEGGRRPSLSRLPAHQEAGDAGRDSAAALIPRDLTPAWFRN
jgi:hypothetical protein